MKRPEYTALVYNLEQDARKVHDKVEQEHGPDSPPESLALGIWSALNSAWNWLNWYGRGSEESFRYHRDQVHEWASVENASGDHYTSGKVMVFKMLDRYEVE